VVKRKLIPFLPDFGHFQYLFIVGFKRFSQSLSLLRVGLTGAFKFCQKPEVTWFSSQPFYNEFFKHLKVARILVPTCKPTI
jgi:hypothetical protein